MYYFNEEGNNPPREEEDEEALPAEFGYFSMNGYRIEKPCHVLEQNNIRKVSCGEGYCLMADCLGRVWSFGLNSSGQLGLGHNNHEIDTSDPTIIEFLKNEKIFIVDVYASSYGASFAITS